MISATSVNFGIFVYCTVRHQRPLAPLTEMPSQAYTLRLQRHMGLATGPYRYVVGTKCEEDDAAVPRFTIGEVSLVRFSKHDGDTRGESDVCQQLGMNRPRAGWDVARTVGQSPACQKLKAAQHEIGQKSNEDGADTLVWSRSDWLLSLRFGDALFLLTFSTADSGHHAWTIHHNLVVPQSSNQATLTTRVGTRAHRHQSAL